MKKVIMLVSVFFLIASTSHAQGVRIGIKGGGNLNKIVGKSFNDGFNFGFHLGAFVEADFNKAWGIQPELIWNQSSSKPSNFSSIRSGNTSVNPLLNPNRNVKLDYFSIPILLRCNIIGGLMSITAGPQYSILLKKGESLLKNGKSAFKEGDFALVVGAQINMKCLRIYGRYNIGLKNLNDIDQQDKWKSQQIQLGLGLRF